MSDFDSHWIGGTAALLERSKPEEMLRIGGAVRQAGR
jgi:hypothetical protein